jgi:hypothetical protein
MCTYLNGNLVAYTGQIPQYLLQKRDTSFVAKIHATRQTSAKVGMLMSAPHLLTWDEQDSSTLCRHGSPHNVSRKPRNHIKFVRRQMPKINNS